MNHFDVAERRELLLGDCGYEWRLSRNFGRARAVGGLASSAAAFINDAIYCLLVGFDQAATDLLKKSEQWLEIAIKENERPQRYFPHGTEASRYRDVALCRWLLRSEYDAKSLQLSIREKDFYYRENARSARDKVAVSLALPAYMNARAYKRALEIFAGVPRLAPPQNLGRIRGEAAMCYVLARHRLDLEYSEEEVTASVHKFLNRNVNSWLTNGHAVTAAEWMKIVYWDSASGKLTPKQAVLKCYDHLPGVTPPPELAVVG